MEMAGGTTFHFLDASPAEALQVAREAAGGQDVRIGGGATVVRDFVAAGLVDHMPLVQVPIVLGRGVRRSEEHTSELQSLIRSSYAVFCLKEKTNIGGRQDINNIHIHSTH